MDVIPDDCWSLIIQQVDEKTATRMARVCRRMRRLVAKAPGQLHRKVAAVLCPIKSEVLLVFDKELDFVDARSNGCALDSLRVVAYMLGRTIAPSDFACRIHTRVVSVMLNDGTRPMIDKDKLYSLARLLEIVVNHKFRDNRICAQLFRDAMTPGAEMVLEKAMRSKQWKHVGPVARCMGERKIEEQWQRRLHALQITQQQSARDRANLPPVKRK